MLSFEYSTLIQAPLDKVWEFHERPDALNLLSPPGTVIVSRKGKLETGARVEFRAPLIGPFRVRWLALHVDCVAPQYFVDEQIRGPFRYWRHEHRFAAESGGTRLTDSIRFSLPLAPVSEWLAGWAVKMRLKAMFVRRHEITRRECEPGSAL